MAGGPTQVANLMSHPKLGLKSYNINIVSSGMGKVPFEELSVVRTYYSSFSIGTYREIRPIR